MCVQNQCTFTFPFASSSRYAKYRTSKGSATTYWRYGDNYYMHLVGNFLLFPTVKKNWKSVKNWQSYHHEFGIPLFWGHSVCSLPHFGSVVFYQRLNSYDLAPSHILSTELYLCHINLLCHCIVITTLFQHLQWSLQTKGSWLKTGFQYFRKDIELTESEEVNRRVTKLVKKMWSTCITVIDWNIWGWCVFIQQGSGVI